MQNKIFFLSLLLIIGTLSCQKKADNAEQATSEATHNSGEGIQFFEGSFAEAKAKAKAENKLIFMDAYASWCGPCKQMKATAFPDAQVGKLFNQKFINVAYDMEVGEGLALSEKYPVQGYPTLFFIDGNGQVVESMIGGRDAAGLLEIGTSIGK